MVTGGMATKWRFLVVSDASRMRASGPKWRVVSALARVRLIEDNVQGHEASAINQLQALVGVLKDLSDDYRFGGNDGSSYRQPHHSASPSAV